MASVKTKVVGGGSAVALLLSIPLIAKWEGKSNDPYNDIVGVKTVCYGETRVQMRRYTDEECLAMLRKAVEKDFMEPIAKSTPTIAERPYELAAATSLAYNIGLSNYHPPSRQAPCRRRQAGSSGNRTLVRRRYVQETWPSPGGTRSRRSAR